MWGTVRSLQLCLLFDDNLVALLGLGGDFFIRAIVPHRLYTVDFRTG